MKKFIVLALVLVALAAAFFVAEGFLDAMLRGGSSASSARRLADVSRRMNAKLPKPLDQATRLDTTTAGPGNRFTYICTLVNYSKDELDLAVFTAEMKSQIINTYKTKPEMAWLRNQQVELRYQYRDKNGVDVVTIAVSPKDF
jgi:hypothetical protein